MNGKDRQILSAEGRRRRSGMLTAIRADYENRLRRKVRWRWGGGSLVIVLAMAGLFQTLLPHQPGQDSGVSGTRFQQARGSHFRNRAVPVVTLTTMHKVRWDHRAIFVANNDSVLQKYVVRSGEPAPQFTVLTDDELINELAATDCGLEVCRIGGRLRVVGWPD